MPFNINDFKSRFSGGGARSYLFQVQMSLPSELLTTNSADFDGKNLSSLKSDFLEKFSFNCKAASLPSSSVSNIEIPFRGRKVYCAGNRVFEPWAVTIINDEDFLVRKAFEFWLGAINGHSSNEKSSGVTSSPKTYQTDATVTQYSQTNNTLRTYSFVNLFPTDISPIELDWGDSDNVEQFTVSFKYDYWKIVSND